MNIETLPNVGAEVTGVDVRTMSNAEFDQIRAAFNDRGLLFFRDQRLSEEDHIALAERFGTINVNRFFAAHPDYRQIALVTKEPEQTTNIGGGWHTDHSYDHEPALGSILVARELPPVGGDTAFVSMYTAYDALSSGLKKTLEGLCAVHSAKHIFGGAGYHARAKSIEGRIGNPDAAEAERSGAPRRHSPSAVGQESALREPRLHDSLRWLDRRRVQTVARLPVFSRLSRGACAAIQVAARLDRILGQPRDLALRAERLPRPPPSDAPDHHRRLPARRCRLKRRASGAVRR